MTWTHLYIRRGDAWDDGRCIAVNEREERCTLPFRHRADEHSTDPSAVDKDPLADEAEFVAVQRQNDEAAKRDRPCPWCDHWLLAGHLAEGCTFCECRLRISFAPHPGFLISPSRARMLADIDAADEDD